jgi:hypothetical protein
MYASQTCAHTHSRHAFVIILHLISYSYIINIYAPQTRAHACSPARVHQLHPPPPHPQPPPPHTHTLVTGTHTYLSTNQLPTHEHKKKTALSLQSAEDSEDGVASAHTHAAKESKEEVGQGEGGSSTHTPATKEIKEEVASAHTHTAQESKEEVGFRIFAFEPVPRTFGVLCR